MSTRLEQLTQPDSFKGYLHVHKKKFFAHFVFGIFLPEKRRKNEKFGFLDIVL